MPSAVLGRDWPSKICEEGRVPPGVGREVEVEGGERSGLCDDERFVTWLKPREEEPLFCEVERERRDEKKPRFVVG